jgi:hypothetical protein
LSTKAELQKELQILKEDQTLLEIQLKRWQLPQYSAVFGNFTKSREYDIEEKLINLQRSQRLLEEQIAELE